MEAKISIAHKECIYKFSLGALFLYENTTGRSWEGNVGLLDTYTLHFCCLLNGTPDADLEFWELIDAVDADPGLGAELSRLLGEQLRRWSLFTGTAAPDDKKKG